MIFQGHLLEFFGAERKGNNLNIMREFLCILIFVIACLIFMYEPAKSFLIEIAESWDIDFSSPGIYLTLIILLAGTIFLIYLAIKSSRRKVFTGLQGMRGLRVKILSDLNHEITGQVLCRGEIWQARAENEIADDENLNENFLKAGSYGIVKYIDGMILIIARYQE